MMMKKKLTTSSFLVAVAIDDGSFLVESNKKEIIWMLEGSCGKVVLLA